MTAVDLDETTRQLLEVDPDGVADQARITEVVSEFAQDLGVQGDVTAASRRRHLHRGGTGQALQHFGDPDVEFSGGGGFEDVAVVAGRRQHRPIDPPRVSGQREHGERVCIGQPLPDDLHGLQPVHHRHVQVEQHDVVPVTCDLLHRRCAVADGVDRSPHPAQHLRDQVAVGRVVLGEQDPQPWRQRERLTGHGSRHVRSQRLQQTLHRPRQCQVLAGRGCGRHGDRGTHDQKTMSVRDRHRGFRGGGVGDDPDMQSVRGAIAFRHDPLAHPLQRHGDRLDSQRMPIDHRGARDLHAIGGVRLLQRSHRKQHAEGGALAEHAGHLQ